MSHSIEYLREQLVALLPRLRRLARTIAGDRHDADDLVQIAVERALLRFEQWRPESPLENWLFGIMRNAWIDEVRGRLRRARVFAPQEDGENISDDAGLQQQNMLAIDAAMARLSDEQRLAIGLVLIEGLSYKEAAEVMQVPMGTLTSRLARGREALAAMLDETPGTAT